MKFRSKVFSAALAAGLVVASASVSNATNGYYMIGTGAKDLGMAGAVVANPQDASTILQNPAGIAWLKGTTADLGGAAFMPKRKLNGHDSDSNLYVIPSAGIAVNPKGCGCQNGSFTFGVGMYGVSGMGVDWRGNNGGTLTNGLLTKVWSNMAMMEMAVGGAYKVNDKLSVGFAPVFVYQTMGLEMDFAGFKYPNPNGDETFITVPNSSATLDSTNAYGLGFDLGAVYKLNDMVQFGLAYKSKRYMQKLEWNTTVPTGMASYMITGDKVKMRLDMPRQIAFGVNVKPINNLKVEADVKWINYHDVMNEVDVTGMATPMGPIKTWNFHWKNQWVFALGAEFAATKALTLRAGFNYAKSPIKDEDLYNNIVAPAIVETHATLGASYKFNKNLELSLAYAHAFEHKQTGKVPAGMWQQVYGKTVEAKMYQDTISTQLTYNF